MTDKKLTRRKPIPSSDPKAPRWYDTEPASPDDPQLIESREKFWAWMRKEFGKPDPKTPDSTRAKGPVRPPHEEFPKT